MNSKNSVDSLNTTETIVKGNIDLIENTSKDFKYMYTCQQNVVNKVNESENLIKELSLLLENVQDTINQI